jgi:hypothetical protein
MRPSGGDESMRVESGVCPSLYGSAIYKSGKVPPDSENTNTLILDFPAPRTEKNIFLLFRCCPGLLQQTSTN